MRGIWNRYEYVKRMYSLDINCLKPLYKICLLKMLCIIIHTRVETVKPTLKQIRRNQFKTKALYILDFNHTSKHKWCTSNIHLLDSFFEECFSQLVWDNNTRSIKHYICISWIAFLNNENITLLFKLHALSSMIYLGQDISPIIVVIKNCSSVISNVSSQLWFYLQNEN